MLTRYFIARGGYHRVWNSAALSGVLPPMPAPEPKPRARPAPHAAPAAKPSTAKRAWTTLITPYDPLTGVVLTIPIFLVYHLGILFVDLRNGADLVTATMLRVLDRSILAYVAITVAVAVGLFVAGRILRKGHHEIDRHALVRVISESAIWAALMLLVVGGVVARIFHGAIATVAEPALQIGGMTLGPLERVVMAAGAGFHEELLFRVILFGGGAWLITQATKDKTRAEWIAAPIAAVVFSAAHYVGALGDHFELASFTFRALAGLWFTLVYRFRGFAVAVYTHTLYDLFEFFAG